MSETAIMAVVLASLAGIWAGWAWAHASDLDGGERRPSFRSSHHYQQSLHFLSSGRMSLAMSELRKASRQNRDATDVQLLLGNLLRELGQVEKAIRVHQGVLSREDLGRGERAYALCCLGMDFRRAGFLDRATSTFLEVLDLDPRNIHALAGLQKLYEEQKQWPEALSAQSRLSRLRKTDDSLVMAYLKSEIGLHLADSGQRDAARKAFLEAIALNRAVVPAYLGLADLHAETNPRRAAAILNDLLAIVPDRAYLAFDRLARAYASCGEPARFVALCERMIEDDPRDWRARLALARHLRADGRHREAFGLLLRALELNPQGMLLHLETWRSLRELSGRDSLLEEYVATAEQSVFFLDPHICTSCRYRTGDMLWRCPHCHEWGTLVEERVAPRE
ncbi:MAG: tetratricopeptide repeat protein [Vicinamibacteria bacterium]|nr:tetratricopeptide repeat protein [Vicinamibacteria bacterium]